MTTETIPDDIRKKAQSVLVEIQDYVQLRGHGGDEYVEWDGESVAAAIAQALMQERERAVRRFLTAADVLAEDDQALSIAAITAIGKAIRSPDKTP